MVLTNSQYDLLMSKYYDKQFKNKDLLANRTKEVYEKIPQLDDLDAQIRSLSLNRALSSLYSDDDSSSSDELKTEIQKVSMQKKKLIHDAGFPDDYLDPIYDCKDCKDTGYIDGKKCHCFEKETVNILYSQSNLATVLQRENFDTFDLNLFPDDYVDESVRLTPRENMKKYYQKAIDYVKNFDNNFENLLIYGNTGVGKTFLTNCIAKELLDSSHTVVYLTALKFFDIMGKNTFSKDISTTTKEASTSYILDSSLLIIDDLGTELNNSFTTSQLYNCIDTRLQSQKATIISTNLSFDDLRDHYSERIFSRITSNYSLIKLVGDDIRIRKVISER